MLNNPSSQLKFPPSPLYKRGVEERQQLDRTTAERPHAPLCKRGAQGGFDQAPLRRNFLHLAAARIAQNFTRLIRILRQLSGDDAYERYLTHHAQAHNDKLPVNRHEFFKQEQERKWNGVRRCC